MTTHRVLGPGQNRPPNTAAESDGGADETSEVQMRRALGRLGKGAADRPQPAPGKPADHRQAYPASRPRHRFVADGEVPVVMVHSGHDPAGGSADAAMTDRLHTAEAALHEERTARDRAERALQTAQATIRDLQTKLGHAMLGHDEAVAALRAYEDRLRAAPAEPDARPQLQPQDAPRIGKRRGRPPGSGRKAAAAPAVATDDGDPAMAAPRKTKASAVKPPARPNGPTPKPVKWWLKGWQKA